MVEKKVPEGFLQKSAQKCKFHLEGIGKSQKDQIRRYLVKP